MPTLDRARTLRRQIAPWAGQGNARSVELDAKRRSIVGERGQVGLTLPGSIVIRTVTCVRTTCRSATDPDQRHGWPYIQCSRTLKGRTVNKVLSRRQIETHLHWDQTTSQSCLTLVSI